MQPIFKYQLDKSEIEKIREYCNSVDYCSVEQLLGWTEISFQAKHCYFMLIDDNEIKSFSKIRERFKFAHIEFGPVCCNRELMINTINEIINYYKKKSFIYLDIQMYYKSGFDTDYIEFALSKHHRIKYIFNNENTKSSYEIDLSQSIEDIHRNFRDGHKWSIKKAVKLGITVEVVKDANEIDSFFRIYSKMCKARNIDEGELSAQNKHEIYSYLIKNDKGQVLVAKDRDNDIVGGIIIVYQGNSVRFFKGASDDDKRDLPVLHIVLYEALKNSKMKGFKYFDFWGYNHFADESNHVFYINYFKKGFGGYYTFFAKKMNISLVPFGYYIYRCTKLLKDLIRR
jgi:lipid II:glycine glycyltransferase (peptidoglycan interpeptide bridge formation enzyme)